MPRAKPLVEPPKTRRKMTPKERMELDASEYVDAVLATLRDEYHMSAGVKAEKSVPLALVMRLLRRSSAEALSATILAKMTRAGLVQIDGDTVHFLPALIADFEGGGV